MQTEHSKATSRVRSEHKTKPYFRSGAVVLALGGALAAALMPTGGDAQTAGQGGLTIKERNTSVSRTRATSTPRSESDQALVDGWPLYRTDRGQAAFNDTMATLQATEGGAPSASAFKGCAELACNLKLPEIGSDGWVPSGRLWVSPTEYVIISHSPRPRKAQRRSFQSMRYFVYHEFHNSSRNTDTYDTISSHSGSVFVPFYLSKESTDVHGRRFVAIVQIAPYDVVSNHASDKGSAGPGVEVAKNVDDTLEPLQATAGVVLGVIIKNAAPHLRVVNHRGTEGQPMLRAYEQRLEALRGRASAVTSTLPFTPASSQRVTAASAPLEGLVARRGLSPRIPVAERGIVRSASLKVAPEPSEEPMLVEPIRRAVSPACATAKSGYLAQRCRERAATRE